MARSTEQVTLTAEECNDLRSRLEMNQLNQNDIASLLSILNVFVSLRQLVEKRKLGLLK